MHFYALHYIDFHRPNRTQPGHCTMSTHHHRTGDSLMVSRKRMHVLTHAGARRPRARLSTRERCEGAPTHAGRGRHWQGASQRAAVVGQAASAAGFDLALDHRKG